MHFLLLPVSSVLFSHVCGVPARLSLSNNKSHPHQISLPACPHFLPRSFPFLPAKEPLPLSPAQVPAPGPGASTPPHTQSEPFYSSACHPHCTLDTDSRSLPLPVPRYKLFHTHLSQLPPKPFLFPRLFDKSSRPPAALTPQSHKLPLSCPLTLPKRKFHSYQLHHRLPALPHTSAWKYGHILLPVPGPPPPDPVPGL